MNFEQLKFLNGFEPWTISNYNILHQVKQARVASLNV